MSFNKKDEDDAGIVKVDRTSVFQEARVFNTSPVSPRRCRILLTKIALLLFTGEKFPQQEATALFFGISKLFQNKDASLRQMVYLVIKELSKEAEDVIMVTSSIMKDTAAVGSDVVYRANAIRALCRIIDASTVQAIERNIKTAIVDKTPSVASAALVSSYHLLPIARDIVRRWQSETQEAASSNKASSGFSIGGFGGSAHSAMGASNNYMTQYHAIGLLYQMRSHDRMALVKMVQQYSAAGVVKSPNARVMLVRLAAKLAHDDPSLRRPMMKLLDDWLRDKSEMVNFEAAKALTTFSDLTDAEVGQAIHVLQLFLTSPRAITKFAAIRILHHFATFKPDSVRSCNPDIESLISNTNRSIATFAITTLLKTGNESSVDRLLKQISTFMSEITDEFKVTVVEAIRTLCLKFPAKQAGMLGFLSGILRDEGGFEFKRAVVESMFDLIKFVPESREEALGQLCEFIEDCEFTKLAVRVLHLLGVEGPRTRNPTKYIRYIYNRVVLENAVVRAAAVTALAKFGVRQSDAELKRSVQVLLTRCLDDTDDEVRDRAALNLRLMKEDDETAARFVRNDSMFSLPVLEDQLAHYVNGGSAEAFAEPFDFKNVPVVTREQSLAEDRTTKLTTATPTLKAPTIGGPATPKNASNGATSGADSLREATAASQRYAQQLLAVPEFGAYGAVLKSSATVELTESETEYVVSAVKHVFREHVVLQFEVKNTLADYVLADVSMLSTPSGADEEGEGAGSGAVLEEEFIIPAPVIKGEETGTVYVSFARGTGGSSAGFDAATLTNVLKFTLKEIDPSTNEPEEGGYDDEYQVEDLEITGADYILPAFAGSFENIWSGLDPSSSDAEEAEETLQLGNAKGLAEAVEWLGRELGMQALEGTDVVVSTSTHQLKLFGRSVGGNGRSGNGGKVAALIRMAYSVDPWAFVRGGGQGSMARVTARGSASFNGPVPGVTGGGGEARSGDVEAGKEEGDTAGVEAFPPLELTVSTSGLGLPDDALREHYAMKDGKGKGHRRRRSSWSELGF
ncbi:coatomer subunit gamma [Friedmanniomyces endolithicus]|nr:coatomer subunit gamma [Friedmanniomyces endolithicus]KAK0813567.1 coatomer subunit gamma [Friedmanniomyces endolithicus]KAK0907639.1 coatomer subunit gamma [Friedmanniomyces endolithicus]